MKQYFYTTIILLLLGSCLSAQTPETERFVQVSGIITDTDYRPVQGVAVISKKLRRGSVSEASGIYSITSSPGDTVYFRALGFKRYHTIIPSDYDGRYVKVDIILEQDTISIGEVTIMPWRNYAEFILDMTREQKPDPLIENMNENLASIYVAISNQTNVAVSPEAAYNYVMAQNFNSMATRGQFPVNNLLNPFAWSRFLREAKNGLFKNQTFNKPTPAKVAKKKKKKN